ncbi:MAG: hypothetical protein OXJ37_17010 [Bryobacterales bacterium]|nr:hypothetical protein [Bryobacterales bacterium]MDE0264107.1 hypothetical protein [Bryobacterales bacterium]
MKKWHRHIRGTVRTALIWAALGALAGAFVELLNDVLPGGLPMGSLFDVWPPVLAVAGFLGGALVSSALRLARRSRIR